MQTAPPVPVPEAHDDRRRAARFRPTIGTLCRFRRCGDAAAERHVGLVWNLSETGVSMLLADPPPCGTRLDAELAAESGPARLAVAMVVVHVHEMPHGDYFLGAHLDRPLALDDLEQFLAPPAAAADRKGR
ncbi:PilZ domain-containing protein [Gemmata sp.]|uniref:PilZ domain-containing protein n=1 Tax=Gemmata sp. TaxID=1914242 RepID=UPI003F70102A